MASSPAAADLSAAILATLSHDAAIRAPAEAALLAQRDAPGFAPALLGLVDAATAPPHVRQAAGVYLKNWTSRFYTQADWAKPEHDADRSAIKAAITEVSLRVPVIVRRQLSEVLAIIAEHEYPNTWRELVPELGVRLRGLVEPGIAAVAAGGATGVACDWVQMQGVLETLHAVFERYPWRERSDPLYTEINFSLEHTQAPVLLTLQLLCGVMGNAAIMGAMDVQTQALVVGNAELVCKVFFCLSWQDLAPFFVENLALFMTELRKLLVYQNPAIDGSADADDDPSCIDKLIVSVLDTLDLFQSKHDEDFRPFLKDFLGETWQLLMRRPNSAKNDGVVTTGIKFLTTVSRSPDFALFDSQETLSQVCQQIVIPNIEPREDDEELFEDNPVEYIRRDMEGSDADTRRRGAVELVKGLCVHFERPVTEAFSSYVSAMIGAQSTWKQKDTALFIVTALGWKKGTVAGGVTETSTLINVLDFFHKQVLPDLKAFAGSPAQLATPIYTADVIKYVIAFRNQIPKEMYGDVIMSCVKLLGAKEYVVHTYAAACIERLLSVKDVAPAPANGAGIGNGATSSSISGNGTPAVGIVRVPRITKEDISPLLTTLLPAVVTALQSSSRPNEYLMRLLLRVITVAKDEMKQYTEPTLGVALSVLNSVIDNPANPQFNHFLFEVVSALIRFAGNQSTVAQFEATLMQPMHTILGKDVVEFGAYVFQVLSQLMALHPGALPSSYSDIVPPLLEPSMWERRGYIRGMVQYLETYIVKNSDAVVQNEQLRPILGVFNKLVASKATDHLGIQLACTVLESYNLATLEGELMNGIVRVLLTRLSAAKTPKYVQNLLYCLSLIVLRFGVTVLDTAMNSLQPGLLNQVLSQVWIPELPSVIRVSDRRICALAMADVACATDLCRSEQYLAMWPTMISATIALTEGVQTDTAGDLSDNDDDGPLESGEAYSGGHSKLRWASGGRSGTGAGRPVVAAGLDPRAVLAERMSTFTGRHPGVYGPLLERLEPAAKTALQAYLASTGATVS